MIDKYENISFILENFGSLAGLFLFVNLHAYDWKLTPVTIGWFVG
jgi:hypothetical protein